MNEDKEKNKTEEGSGLGDILGSENLDFDLIQISDLISRYKILVISIIATFTLGSLFYALSLDKYYRASILLVSDQQHQQSSSIAGLLGSLTVGSSGDLAIGSNNYNSEMVSLRWRYCQYRQLHYQLILNDLLWIYGLQTKLT